MSYTLCLEHGFLSGTKTTPTPEVTSNADQVLRTPAL